MGLLFFRLEILLHVERKRDVDAGDEGIEPEDLVRQPKSEPDIREERFVGMHGSDIREHHGLKPAKQR
jgi:hypothetical protein